MGAVSYDYKTARLCTRTSDSPTASSFTFLSTTAQLQNDSSLTNPPHQYSQHLMSTIATASKWPPYITVLNFATFLHICPSLRYSRTPIASDTATASDPHETQPFRHSGNFDKYLLFQCCCRVYVLALCLSSSISCCNRSGRLPFMLTFL
jgi:hypothetical protein